MNVTAAIAQLEMLRERFGDLDVNVLLADGENFISGDWSYDPLFSHDPDTDRILLVG